jgi:hypothetical protein
MTSRRKLSSLSGYSMMNLEGLSQADFEKLLRIGSRVLH